MKRNLLLTLLAAALCVGCASQPVVQTRGSLQEVARQGTTYHLDAARSGLGENEIRSLRDRLQKAGLTPASAESAKLIVTLRSESHTSTGRHHTGGKNGVAYDHEIDDRGILLEVSSTDSSSTSAGSLLNAALAGLGG